MRYIIFCLILSVGIVAAQDVLWVRDGDWNEAHFGQNIYALDDQNNDGFADWMVSSPGSTSQPSGLDDRVDFFYGGNPPSQTPYLTFRPREGAEAPYMYNRRPIGDFNGDGIIDWVIGYWIPGLDSATFEFHGGGQGSDTIPEAVLRVPYEVGRDRIAGLGDHNGDGFDDIYYHFNGLDQTYVFFGASDWNMTFDLTNRGEPIGSGNSDPTVEVYGDFNGDGFDDYLVRIISGITDSTFTYFGSSFPDTIPDLSWFGNFAFPATLSADMNSDGAADLAVTPGPGTIEVHLGGDLPSPIPTFVLEYAGCSNVADFIQTAGDYNQDGYEDLVIVDANCDNGFGRLCLFLGGPWLNPDPVLQLTGLGSPPFNNVPIFRATGLGDINGDGVDDLAIGCQGQVLDGRRGRVVILSGDTTLIVPAEERFLIAENYSLTVFPNPVNGVATIKIEQPLYTASNVLTIFNMLGQIVNRFTLVPGSQNLAYDVSALPTGHYIVQALSNTSIATQKLVVLK